MDDDVGGPDIITKVKKFSKESPEQEIIEDEPTYLDVFKNKEFMKLVSGQFFSNFGDAIFRIAIMIYVYEVTKLATAATLILAVQTLPWILIGPIAGVFADRISRKTIMVSADIVRGSAILVLPFMGLISPNNAIYGIAIIAFLLGAASATFVAPRSAAVPEITGLRLYVKAISLSQLVFQTLAVVGPLFAAPIYVFLGEKTFWITSGCYFVSAIIIFVTKIPSAQRDKEEIITFDLVFKDLKDGFRYLIKHPTVRLLIFLFTFIIIGTAFAGPLLLPYLFEIKYNGIAFQYFNTVSSTYHHPIRTMQIFNPISASTIPYFNNSLEKLYLSYNSKVNLIDRFLEGSNRVNLFRDLANREFGYIGAIAAFGSIAGNLIFGKFEKKIGRPRAMAFGSLAISLYYFAFLFRPGLYVLLAIALFQGFMNGMFSLAINALFAENVPNEIRGRAYSATNAYIQVFSVACLAVSGLTADSIGIIVTITGAGIFLLITTVIIMIFTKNFRFSGEPPNPLLNLID